jgi:hypothetical protein
MSGGTKGGFLHFLQRLFSLGGNKQPAQPAKKNRPSHAPKRKPPDRGSAKKEPPNDKPAKKEPPSRDKPAKKVAKPKPGTKPKAPPPAAPAEAPGEAPPHEGPAADRQKESPEEKAAPSVYTPATPEKPERKTEPGAKPAQSPAGPAAAPGRAPPEERPLPSSSEPSDEVKKRRSSMQANKEKIRDVFSRLPDRIGHTSDVRRALGGNGPPADHSDYVLKDMMADGEMRRLDHDAYQLAKPGEKFTPTQVPPPGTPVPRKARRGRGSY